MLDLDYDITRLRGADYNPRKISDDDLARLRESVTKLSVVKPLIVRNDLLVAGHQRTKALRAASMTRGPVFLLSQDTTTYDEVRFNQLHNGTDLDVGGEDAVIPGGFTVKGYHVIADAGVLAGNMRAQGALVRQEIANLITKYGPWGGVVATFSGRVIHASQYALAAKMTRTPLTVFAIPDAEEELYRSFLDRTYGVFNYDGLERKTYIQTLAQMVRLRKGPSGKENRSWLYEGHALPWLEANRTAAFLDFGSGQGDYFLSLKRRGHPAYEIEFFRRVGFAKAIDLSAVNRMIDMAIVRLEKAGRFDCVVCDSVLNSVDSLEAEASVMATINAMCRPGGRVFFSGRPLEKHETAMRRTKQTNTKGRKRETYFYDEHGFSALYREGNWFYQKFHSAGMVAGLADRFGLEIVKHVQGENSWQVEAIKARELPWATVAKALDFEFDLPVGETRRVGRNMDMCKALERFYADADHQL